MGSSADFGAVGITVAPVACAAAPVVEWLSISAVWT